MNKKCDNCSNQIGEGAKYSAWYEIWSGKAVAYSVIEFDVKTEYICETCWHHKNLSQKYLGVKIEEKHWPSRGEMLGGYHKYKIQRHQNDGDGKSCDWQLIQEGWHETFTHAEYQQWLNNPNDRERERERERERAFWTISKPIISSQLN